MNRNVTLVKKQCNITITLMSFYSYRLIDCLFVILISFGVSTILHVHAIPCSSKNGG